MFLFVVALLFIAVVQGESSGKRFVLHETMNVVVCCCSPLYRCSPGCGWHRYRTSIFASSSSSRDYKSSVLVDALVALLV